MEKFYRQCSLQKGERYQTTWLPEKYSVINKYLKLKNEDGSWEDGWLVIGVYHRMRDKDLLALKDAYRTQREVSDI